LRLYHEVVLVDDLTEATRARFTDYVILAISEATSAAVHAARSGHGRALILLAPIPIQVLPEIDLDLRPRVDEAFKMAEVIGEVAATDDPEQRRSVLADGMVRLLGKEIPSDNIPALRGMLHDHADQILDSSWEQGSSPASYEDELAALNVPVLVVAAGQDPYAAAIGRALAERAPEGDVKLLDTTQILYPWLSQPEAAAEAVTRFLSTL